jgi:hypothetical protein
MKKLVVLLTMGLFMVTAKAQFPFDLVYEQTDIYASAADTNVVVKGYIINTSGKNITFNWMITTANGFPSSWVLKVADKNGTYAASSTVRKVTIADGDSSILNLYLNPHQKGSVTRVTVDISDETDPFDIVEAPIDFYVSALGIDKPTTPVVADMQLFPNPVNNVLTINLPTQKPVTIQLFNALGQVQQTIIHQGITPTTIDMQGLAQGMYYIRYVDENGQAVSKPVQKF